MRKTITVNTVKILARTSEGVVTTITEQTTKRDGTRRFFKWAKDIAEANQADFVGAYVESTREEMRYMDDDVFLINSELMGAVENV